MAPKLLPAMKLLASVKLLSWISRATALFRGMLEAETALSMILQRSTVKSGLKSLSVATEA